MRRSTTLLVLGLAAALTVLNALKPPLIDDPPTIEYARQFAAHPWNPYGFDFHGKPAHENLFPPILPVWLALGIPVFGAEPIVLKLRLFPIHLALIASLLALLRRFAPGKEIPLLLIAILSPAILPSSNLMLDIPVMALSLSAVAIFLWGFDRESTILAVAAGLIAGVAMETKYTAFVLPALFVGHAVIYRRWKPVLIGALTAILVFIGCESLFALKYGESHFLMAMRVRDQQFGPIRLMPLLLAGVTLLGGLAAVLWLVGLTALGVRRGKIVGLAAALIGGYAALILIPDSAAVLLRDPTTGQPWLIVNHVVFVLPGLGFTLTLSLVVRKLLMRSPAEIDPTDKECRKDWFLFGWLLLECVGYFAISPFPAARRVLGILTVSILLIGRLASRTCIEPGRRRLVERLAWMSVFLGCGYYAIDWRDARAEYDSVRQAAALVRQRDPDAVVRCRGRWGFVYHAECMGISRLEDDRLDLQPGEWLIVDDRYPDPLPLGVVGQLEFVDRIVIDDRIPISTQRTFYGGRTPLIHYEGPQGAAVIYRRKAHEAYTATDPIPPNNFSPLSKLSIGKPITLLSDPSSIVK